jgi:hypothetical protein
VQACVGLFAGFTVNRTGRYLEQIWVGITLMTLAISLYILFDVATPYAVIACIQVLNAFGIGMVFQPNLIAIQAFVAQEDVAAATALLGFVRSMSTSVSTVIGSAVLLLSMKSQASYLRRTLPDSIADQFAGATAVSSVTDIRDLQPEHRLIIKEAYVVAMKNMWIMYACVAGLGLLTCLFIHRKPLSKNHTDTRTGIRPTAPLLENDVGIVSESTQYPEEIPR